MRKLIPFILFIIISSSSFGQEILIDLQTLPIQNNAIKKSKVQTKAKASLGLPFFDDFSKRFSSPDPSKWIDSYVLINQTYAINPPTIGVATFDAINQSGKLYSHLTTLPLPADTLTSRPINLNLLEEDSLYLSFQYQPKGLGKEPQTGDSLLVEFYSINDNKWLGIWSASANFRDSSIQERNHLNKKNITRKARSIDSTFFSVMLPIKDEQFRKDSFQFRFRNYASFQPNLQVPSIRGNGDHWHIDLVYLDSARTINNTILDDVTFSKPIKSFLKNYESIPWKHFTTQAARQAEITDPRSISAQYKNLGPNTWKINREITITNLSDPNTPYVFAGDEKNILAYEIVNYERLYDYTFQSNWTDSAKFNMKIALNTDIAEITYDRRWNDTVSYTQRFFNYYAYDDGSSEGGYGWWGEGTQNAMVALKYHTYVSDSLKGILIYFNQLLDFSPKFKWFDLVVWKDNNGKPGTELYRKTVSKPIRTYNTDSLYIIDKKLKLSDNFWIGTVNGSEDMLNIGFDLNNNHNDRLYYNLYGTWEKSKLIGSLMMKPVFGEFALGQTGIKKPVNKPEFTIYPNPAANQVSINLDEKEQPERIRIINLAGQIILSKSFDNNIIDVSNLPTGIYIFQLTLRNQTTTSKKLVIIK